MSFHSDFFCANTKTVDAYPEKNSEFFDTLKKKMFYPSGCSCTHEPKRRLLHRKSSTPYILQADFYANYQVNWTYLTDFLRAINKIFKCSYPIHFIHQVFPEQLTSFFIVPMGRCNTAYRFFEIKYQIYYCSYQVDSATPMRFVETKFHFLITATRFLYTYQFFSKRI